MTTTTSRVAAEISITGSGVGRFGWRLFAPHSRAHDATGSAPSETEAVWLAMDALRDDDVPPRGRVAVHHTDGRQVAYAPAWCVPQYPLLAWEPHWTPVTEQIEVP